MNSRLLSIAGVWIVLSPGTFLAQSDAGAIVRKEGKHVALELKKQHWEILKDPDAYLKKLDAAYEAYAELVGGTPFNGDKMRILEVDEYPGGWAVAGNPVKWHSKYVAESLEQINQGDCLFGLLHEMGHNFDLDYKWVWNAEFFANLKMVYALEKAKLRVRMSDQAFDYADPKGAPIEAYYRDLAGGSARATHAEDDKPLRDWFNHGDAATHKFLLLKKEFGWEPFAKTFKAIQALSGESVPDTNETKLALFIHVFGNACSRELWKRFQDWGFPIVKPDVYDPKASASDFGKKLRSASQFFKGFRYLMGKDGEEGWVEVRSTPLVEFEYGLRSHSVSSIVYTINKKYTKFSAIAFPRGGGRVEFKIKLDGKEAWASGVLKGDDEARPVELDAKGVQVMELVITDGGDGINCDAADWIDAYFTDGQNRKVYLDDVKPDSAKQGWGTLQTKHDLKGQKASVRVKQFPKEEVTIQVTLDGQMLKLEKSESPGIYRAKTKIKRTKEAFVQWEVHSKEHGFSLKHLLPSAEKP